VSIAPVVLGQSHLLLHIAVRLHRLDIRPGCIHCRDGVTVRAAAAAGGVRQQRLFYGLGVVVLYHKQGTQRASYSRADST
jgi:hypothetical protein